VKREDRQVSLVYLVCLVCLVKPDKPDRPDEPDPPALVPPVRAAILLGRTAGRSFSADRPPASLGIHEGSFEAFAFFAELQTIFLDPTIDFPP
jgi:hypothetical protein